MELSNEILSDVTVHMKYAKYIPELKRREPWEELVTRNMEMHIKKFPSLEQEIKDNYKFVYDKMVLPSMRSLQFGGKPIEISPNRIYNCCFAPIDDWRVFSEIMFLLLGGTGVGYSVQYHHVEVLPEIRKPSKDRKRRWLVSDSIEGWADAVNILIKSYFFGGSQIEFDFSDIRPKGARLITSGGKAPGPQPLKECLIKVEGVLDTKNDGEKLKPIEVHDIVCHIADAVLAGGIRRAALISLFSATDEEMIGCKSGAWWEKNPQRGRSNNSAVLMRHKLTKNYFIKLWKRIEASGSGEPGIYLSNDKDWGTNPCCFIGSTLVATADGRNAVSIKQLCDENYRGPVYSVQAQTGQVITSHCSNVWKSRENAELVKVTLDDNSSFICTPDHRIMIRNGQYVQAQHLVEGTSLMPFNSYKRSDRNYRMIQSNTGRDIAQYAHVAQYYDIIKEGYNPQHIHHKDGNGLNDLPENLEAVDAVEHNRQHMLGEMNAFHKMSSESYQSWVKKQSSRQQGVNNTNSNGLSTEDMIDKCYEKTVQKRSKLSHKEVLDVCGVKFLSKGRLKEMNSETVGEFAEKLAELANHKVVSVEFLSEREDVYDMTVENTHNFAIITSYKDDNFINSSGVFVHNCEIALRPYQFCNLTEINVSNVESQEDYENRVRAASFIGTLQAGYTDFHYLRPIWKRTTEKDALIGISMTGIGSGKVLGLNMVAAAKVVKQENKRVAQLIGINKAARTTTVKPAGTTSLTLGTSSGIHAWHNDYYIRRVRVGKNEAIYTFLSENHPELIEDEYFRPHDTAVIGIPQKAPEGAILRNESPIQLLERVKKVHQEWIKPGHRTGSNTHNVSATISIREHEWPAVGEWMWENKDFYNGLSVLPYSNHTYKQAPFEDCTEGEYEKLMLTLKDVDLSKIIELDDDTDLKGEAACSGGSCEIK
jgi:hypothetical protein